MFYRPTHVLAAPTHVLAAPTHVLTTVTHVLVALTHVLAAHTHVLVAHTISTPTALLRQHVPHNKTPQQLCTHNRVVCFPQQEARSP